MNKRLFTRASIALLLIATLTVIIGAWARITDRAFADTLLGVGLIGTVSAIVLLAVLFGVKSRTSNR